MTFGTRLYELWKQMQSQWSPDPLERCRWIKFPAMRRSLTVYLEANAAPLLRSLVGYGIICPHKCCESLV